MRNSAATLLCLVLAEPVLAHGRPAPLAVRLVGATADTGDDAYAAGKRLLNAGDVVGALAAFQRAAAKDPQSVDALNGIGVSYDRLGRPDLARAAYEAGLALAPRSPALLNNYGYSLVLAGDQAAAVAPLRGAAASDDPVAAAAATATLAQLAVAVAEPEPADPAVAQLHIEQTSNGEQRLTFGAARPTPASATLGDAAALTRVAAAWTAADDARLLREAGPVEPAAAPVAATTATAASAPMAAAEPLPTAPVPPVSAPAPFRSAMRRAAIVAGARASERPAAPTTPDAAPALSVAVLVASADAVALRRRRGVDGDPGPVSDDDVEFDSDDAELNAFAARVRRVAVRTAGMRWIAESFRA